MKTPAQIKGWLEAKTTYARDKLYKQETLKYIKSLENSVAGYTQRDGKMEEPDGHPEH